MSRPPFTLSRLSPVWLALAITLIFIVKRLFEWQVTPQDYYEVTDGDVLLRLSVLRDLLSGTGWQDHVMTQMNAPYGIETPWTRLVDILALLCAAPFLLFLPMSIALEAGGFVYSAALLLTCVWLMARTIRLSGSFPLAGCIVALAFPFLPSILMGYFQTGNIDHHSLLATLAVLGIYASARMSIDATDRTPALLMGAAIGFGIWNSIEFQIVTGVFYLWLGLQWCLTGNRLWMRQLCLSASTATLVLLIGLVSEHPLSRFWLPVYDSLSIVQLSSLLGTAVASYALSLSTVHLRSLTSRLIASAIAAAALLAVLLHFFPLLPLGPMAKVSAEMKAAFLTNVAEMHPSLTYEHIAPGLACLFFPLISLGLWLKFRRIIPFSPYLLLLLLGTLIFAALTAQALRMAIYLAPFSLLLLLHLLSHLARLPKWEARINSPVVVTLIAFSPLYVFMAADEIKPSFAPLQSTEISEQAKSLTAIESCYKDLITQTESGALQAELNTTNPVLTYADWSPYLVWKGGYDVVTGNYHRNEHGYLEAQTVLEWNDPARGMEILKTRSIGALIVCSSDLASPLASYIRQTQPAGITPLPALTPEGSALRVYRIHPNLL